ncbi:6-phosphogluconolactonase [Corynebacterium atrinae]|uniref:6-phosphogluconolactonase n=1 Tax=Corynebacterium atrinae TaxID=1336740 RepID=UPI0025B39CD8|nr:6-phosphogluconolactonase [Corynebacterium atrinae]WJY63455.1 6-phosphogluconolactonase [Corynebacterium atrinae]
MVTVHRVPDLESLISDAALRFVSVVNEAISERGVAHVVITGGGAGIGLLRHLRALPNQIDWTRVHVFFGDERNVDLSHEESNERQAREALLDHVDIPAENIHGYGLDGSDMKPAVAAYTEAIATYAPGGFDLHLLGMGHEGHINSLFPHSAAVAEENLLVVAVEDSPKPPAERVTLTLPAVASAERVWLLVSGGEKAEAASHVIAGSPAVEWPAAGARGRSETVLFLTDDAAEE